MLTKVFGEVAIPLGGATTVTFTLTNPNPGAPLAGLAFTDNLPAGLTVASPAGITGTCVALGATITAPAGGSVISLANLTLAAGASCTLILNVRGVAEGPQTNTVTAVSVTGGTGPGATATIFVGSAFQVSYAANLNVGESYVNVSNNGLNGAPLLGPGFGGAVGNICINAYTFSPDEQLISCCSCLVTPNGLANLGVNRDLTSKTLTGVIPTSAVIKLVASLAGTGGTGTSCTNSAATVTAAQLSGAQVAWSTTIHGDPSAGFRVTEKRFSAGSLSAGELASITGRCAAILGNGSGFGVCRSCAAGALGAASR